MQDKFLRFISNKLFLQKFVIVAVLTVLLVALFKMSRQQQVVVTNNKKAKELVGRIGEMEAKIRQKTSADPRLRSGKASQYVLEGTMKQDEEIIALINGAPYHQGDKIDEFEVTEVAMNSVVLVSGKSGERKQLILKEMFEGKPVAPVKKSVMMDDRKWKMDVDPISKFDPSTTLRVDTEQRRSIDQHRFSILDPRSSRREQEI